MPAHKWICPKCATHVELGRPSCPLCGTVRAPSQVSKSPSERDFSPETDTDLEWLDKSRRNEFDELDLIKEDWGDPRWFQWGMRVGFVGGFLVVAVIAPGIFHAVCFGIPAGIFIGGMCGIFMGCVGILINAWRKRQKEADETMIEKAIETAMDKEDEVTQLWSAGRGGAPEGDDSRKEESENVILSPDPSNKSRHVQEEEKSS